MPPLVIGAVITASATLGAALGGWIVAKLNAMTIREVARSTQIVEDIRWAGDHAAGTSEAGRQMAISQLKVLRSRSDLATNERQRIKVLLTDALGPDVDLRRSS